MTPEQFRQYAQQGYSLIPLTKVLLSDLDTPLSLYLRLANLPFSCLLESVQGGERFGRYSFIGLQATRRLEIRGNHCRWLDAQGQTLEEAHDPLHYLQQWLQKNKAPRLHGLPRFSGGLVGYLGYDLVRLMEPRLASGRKSGDEAMADGLLLWCDQLAIVDNLACTLTLVVYVDPSRTGAYEEGQHKLAELEQRLQQPLPLLPSPVRPATPPEVHHLISREEFKRSVQRAKDYIRDGDLMQVVLSQPMMRSFTAHPLVLYRALRHLNPSPYLYYFDFADFHVVGASPEILVRLEEDRIYLRPVAGSRPRGATLETDEALARELLSDQKELAEHLMLLDLGRNDVGRVAVAGSVAVKEKFAIERYSHIMHIVSQVEGRLQPGLSAIDVLRATFPAGTLSGAPKVRAMELIDELEPYRRSIYSGAVGYFSLQGDMDLAIAIRTALVTPGQLKVQAGAGIVADSNLDAEWVETCNKAKAILLAAQMAETGLVIDTHLGTPR